MQSNDTRSGALTLALDTPLLRPDFRIEQRLQRQGFTFIAGVDEVGRGPLAGPVVSAAVVLDPLALPDGLDDSKKLSAEKREHFYGIILQSALAVSIATVAAVTIDKINILQAALITMRRALQTLALPVDYALIDGRDVPLGLPCRAEALIKGDQRSMSIAAASIVAKVTRDRMMACVGKKYPQYGLEQHVGYATAWHRDAISRHGPLADLHRFSFAPIKGNYER